MELVALKFLLSVAVVLALSFVAEHASLTWAGILAGVPTGSAISLYFFALEQGREFAGRSALYNMLGLAAMQAGLFAYWRLSARATRHKIPWGLAGMLAAYLAASVALTRAPATAGWAIAVPLAAILVFRRAGRAIPDRRIEVRIRPGAGVLLFRALTAAAVVLAVTGSARAVGPEWAGLFSAFPATVLPLILIMHVNYDEHRAYAIIKYVPDGLGSLLLYSLILYLAYPAAGLYAGLGLAYLGVAAYLALYAMLRRRGSSPRSG